MSFRTIISPTADAVSHVSFDTVKYNKAFLISCGADGESMQAGEDVFLYTTIGLAGSPSYVGLETGSAQVNLDDTVNFRELVCGPRYAVTKSNTSEPIGVYLWYQER
jgi:outer membrane usher protein FimD/PapC